MQTGKFYGVGIGPGDPGYLTLKAVEVLRRVEVIFTVVGKNSAFSVSRQVVDGIEGVGAEKKELVFSMDRDWQRRRRVITENAVLIEAELAAGKDCAFATLGDPMTYSTFGYVLAELKQRQVDLAVEVVPGITSFAALAARSGEVLVEDEEILRVIPGQNVVDPETVELPPGSTTVIMKSYQNRDALVEKLGGRPDCRLVYGSRLALEGEFVSTDPQAILASKAEYLALLAVKRKASVAAESSESDVAEPPLSFPVNLLLKDRLCLVVGGGRVALRKVRRLLASGARLRVVAPEPAAEFGELEDAGWLELFRRPVAEEDLDEVFLCFLATDDHALNLRLLELARVRRVLACAVDENWPAGDFLTPAGGRYGDFQVTVSSEGQNCRGSQALRDRILMWLKEE